MAMDPALLDIRSAGVDYGMLAQMVDTCGQPWAPRMAEILRNTPLWIFDKEGRIIDGKKRQMMMLDRGDPYRWMLEHLFPAMRSGVNVVKCAVERIILAPEPIEETADAESALAESSGSLMAVEPDTIAAPAQEAPANPAPAPAAPGVPFALYSNLLYDAVAIPNLGFEVALSRRLSIAADWHYAWWQSEKRHRHWKTYGGYLALRYRFGQGDDAAGTPFRGHHVGIYGQALLYNFEWGGKGYMSGTVLRDMFHNPTVAAGVEYGYTLPLARRFSLDFNIGVGYMWGQYYEYTPIDDHNVWQATKQRRFFGPTKLEVNLVWLIGRGNTNNKKGGAK